MLDLKYKFILAFALALFGGTNVLAQCGPAGLDPCNITKIVTKTTKTVVKRTQTVKKGVVKEVNKATQAKSSQTKAAKTTTKTGKNNTSIYDSLMVKPEKAKSSADIFPVNNVIIGQTTERQLQILGGKRNVFTDDKTGAERVYYTLNNMNFWVRDGVADSTGIMKFIDNFPAKWLVLGFNFNLSYNESVALLKNLGYTVETSVSLPKLEEIGKKSTTARVTGTKNGEVPVLISMSFLLDSGKNFDSPESLLYMFAGVKH